MAKRKLILTQRQLDEIVGGNSAWLDNVGSGFREDGNNAVYTGEKLDNTDAEPLTTDKFSSERTLDYGPWIPGGRGGSKSSMVYTNGMIACSKGEWANRNIVSESNDELDNSPISISSDIQAKNGSTASHAMGGKATFNAATTAVSRMKADKKAAANGDIEAAQRFQNRGGDDAFNAMKNLTTSKATNLNNQKKAAMERGESNAFQKPQTFKTGATGKAHTPKGNNGILTFEQ